MLHSLPNGHFNSYEGGIMLEAQYHWRFRDRIAKFFFGENEVNKRLGPPYRYIKIVRGGQFWNFREKKFTDYVEQDCNKLIHRADETNIENFFNVYERTYEKNSNS